MEEDEIKEAEQPTQATDLEIIKEIEAIDTSSKDFFDLEKEFTRETPKQNLEPASETEQIQEEQPESLDYNDGIETEFLEEIDEEIDDETEEKLNFLNAETLAKLIRQAHVFGVPLIFAKLYKAANFKKDELTKIEKLLLKERTQLDRDKIYIPTAEEMKLKKRYNLYLDYKENRAPLTADQEDMIEKAIIYQLNKMGVSNIDLGINPLLQAYGLISIDKGAEIGIDKFMTK